MKFIVEIEIINTETQLYPQVIEALQNIIAHLDATHGYEGTIENSKMRVKWKFT